MQNLENFQQLLNQTSELLLWGGNRIVAYEQHNSIVHMQNTKPQTLINNPLYQIKYTTWKINEMCTMIAPHGNAWSSRNGEKRLIGFLPNVTTYNTNFADMEHV